MRAQAREALKARPNAVSSVGFGVFAYSDPNLSANKDADTLRKEIMDFKGQIDIYEREISKSGELLSMIHNFIEDFQFGGHLNFYENAANLADLAPTPEKGIQMIKNGISNFIAKHRQLDERFALELHRAKFNLENQLLQTQLLEEKENAKLADSLMKRNHQENIVKTLNAERKALMRNIVLKNQAIQRHIFDGEKRIQKMRQDYDENTYKLLDLKQNLDTENAASRTLETRLSERRNTKEEQEREFYRLKNLVEITRKQLKTEAYNHNSDISALDFAKDELQQLCATIGSYRDNLKTQELLDAEIENKRLRSILNIERNDADRILKKELKKTSVLEDEVRRLTEQIQDLNSQIASTEQKLQTQMMRIPDFNQLHQALDRVLAQSKKYEEHVMERKYFLDDIRDRNRVLELQEIQESKARMSQLRQTMPLLQESDKLQATSLPSLPSN